MGYPHFGDSHDHRGEYADPRHDHDGDYSEKYHRHDRDYADENHTHDPDYADKHHEHPDIVSDYRETIEALRGQLVTREAVAAMLEAFRVDMRGHFSGNADELEQIKAGFVTRLEALRDRVGELDAPLEQAEAARRNHNSQIGHLSDRLGRLEEQLGRLETALERLEAALDVLDGEGQADDDEPHLTAAELEREAELGPGDNADYREPPQYFGEMERH